MQYSWDIENQRITWRDEEPLRFENNIEKSRRLKKYIKGELMNYYLYLSKYYELMDEKYILRNKSVGGSFAPMPDGPNSSGDGLPHRIVMHESSVEILQQPFVDKLEIIDSWLSILTESQYNVIKTYVMKYQCENAHEAALELKYEEDTLNKYTRRAINRIYSRITKIL